MRSMLRVLACGLLLLAALTAGANDNGKLLPTASLAKQVRSVGTRLSDSPPGTTIESQRRAGLVVRDQISQFIVDQIAAKPGITQEELRAQLQAILGSNPYVERGCDHPPYVFTNTWFGPKGTVQFAIAYQIGLGFMGPKGSLTVIESYLVENGNNVRRVARGGAEFDDYVVSNFQMVAQFYNPAEIWVLASGMIQGASGRGLRGRATVYRAGADAVKIAWDDGREDNLAAQRNDIGWEVHYADPDLLYGNDPNPYFFDVYEIDHVKRTFSRVVHFQHPQN